MGREAGNVRNGGESLLISLCLFFVCLCFFLVIDVTNTTFPLLIFTSHFDKHRLPLSPTHKVFSSTSISSSSLAPTPTSCLTMCPSAVSAPGERERRGGVVWERGEGKGRRFFWGAAQMLPACLGEDPVNPTDLIFLQRALTHI